MARGAHKVHPNLFRLGVNKNWISRWYTDKHKFADTFLSDDKIREAIEKDLKTAGVASVIIKRSMSKILVDISVARPGVVIGKGGTAIVKLKEKLTKIAKQEVEPKIFEVKSPETVAKLIAESIAFQCERRVNPKVAAEKAKAAAVESGKIKGISIWIGGRIKGSEMARREKVTWGKVPRHTLRADVDYAFTEAQVPGAGKHGIKVWVNNGEKNKYSLD
ncbi:MAG: 30S ribosomal protein S3 [Candidatus Dojkabacteria bacterium]|nr:30S ribosomal protein S3 [Candidatus Dojkabacteria bacterium]MDQ7021383.1 30S ribosomal protein S3 [Candidatus Dojkabacteria bacterium]